MTAATLDPLAAGTDPSDEALAARAATGDDRALRELFRRYRSRLHRMAGRYFLHGGDRDDLVQESMIALYKAISDFDPGRGVPFAPFADLCVQRQLISAVRAATRLKHAVLAEATELTEYAEATCRTGYTGDPARSVLARETLGELKGFLDSELSGLERGALWLHLDGVSLKDSADRLCTRSKAVDNALQRARRKMHAWADVVVTEVRAEPATAEVA
jgi:RNA polymerase sporulation-specific sigma factor